MQTAAKPSLQGVRIKARKGAVKAHAKHEPTGQSPPQISSAISDADCLLVFRDQLYKHLETVPPEDFDAFTNKLIQAGGQLELLKYAEALFEILFVGGLLQPGGNYIDDGAPSCSWAIVNAKEPASVDDLKKYVDVYNKLIRRQVPNSDPRIRYSAHDTLDTNISRNRWKNLRYQHYCNTSIAGRLLRKINSR